MLVRVRFESLTGRKLRVYVLHDPGLSNEGNDDSGASQGGGLVSWDGKAAAALLSSEGFRRRSSGFLGTSDGWTDLRDDHRMNWEYSPARNGNVVQLARLPLNGRRRDRLTLALGFGADRGAALGAARGSLQRGFGDAWAAYAQSWHRWIGSLKQRPASAAAHGPTYWVSLMVLAAAEDKTYSGAGIASPSMPWAWGELTVDEPSDAYHLVWSRDLYQVGTALIAAGDREGAQRALDFLFERQQKADGSFPQNSLVDGTPKWTNLQMDEVALPIVLAWQLRDFGGSTYNQHVKPAANFVAANGPFSPQERWENQDGYSPGTIAAEIAGLVAAADIARRNGDDASARSWLATADAWHAKLEDWTVTDTGPYSSEPYYLRLTKDKDNPDPNAGVTYAIGDSGPEVDQRKVVDPSFLELVRLGVKRHDDATIRNTVAVVDQQLAAADPSGRYFWHRFNFDGYGEAKDGSPWRIGLPANPTEVWANNVTIGRNWPLFGGERGEYELLAGDKASARARLGHIASAGNDGYMLPEQVWAPDFPPTGQPGFAAGEGTFSATPLAWSHAQYVRLAWSIEAGKPVERPRIVACRYASC